MGTFATDLCLGGVHPAPPFAVRSFDGKTMRLADFRGRPVVLDFWATWCAPCRASMPHLDALQQRFQPQGLVVIGLSVDESGSQAVKRFAQRLGVGFRLAMADDQVLDAYGPIRLLPTTFFINRRGEIVRRVVGQIDPETMETYVLELF
jgi:thiol-disulfide isomerase/thioredoxin